MPIYQTLKTAQAGYALAEISSYGMVASEQKSAENIMTSREILLKMLEWIAKEQEKATKPGAESFEFTSLTYCASKAGAGEQLGEVIKLLQTTSKAEGGTTDAMRPFRTIFLINRTLATLA